MAYAPGQPYDPYAPVQPYGQYGGPNQPYGQYGGPNQPYDQYGGPVQPYGQYGGPPPPYDPYGGPVPPYDQYGGPPPPYDPYGGPPPPYDEFGGPGPMPYGPNGMGPPPPPHGGPRKPKPVLLIPDPPADYTGPPGLYLLEPLDAILIQQEVEILEIITEIEMENRYKVLNNEEMPLYRLQEHSDCCNRQILDASRPFTVTMTDSFGNVVLTMERLYPCYCCWIPICVNEVRVSTGANELLGIVRQDFSCCLPKFSIVDAAGTRLLRIDGPFCTNPLCTDVQFPVLNLSGTTIGMITKQWGGHMKETFTDADTFGVLFPADLDIIVKALLIGASILIDFMYYEKAADQTKPRRGRRHRGHHRAMDDVW